MRCMIVITLLLASSVAQTAQPVAPSLKDATICVAAMDGNLNQYLIAELAKHHIAKSVIDGESGCDPAKSAYSIKAALDATGTKHKHGGATRWDSSHDQTEYTAAVRLVLNSDGTIAWADNVGPDIVKKLAEAVVYKLAGHTSWYAKD